MKILQHCTTASGGHQTCLDQLSVCDSPKAVYSSYLKGRRTLPYLPCFRTIFVPKENVLRRQLGQKGLTHPRAAVVIGFLQEAPPAVMIVPIMQGPEQSTLSRSSKTAAIASFTEPRKILEAVEHSWWHLIMQWRDWRHARKTSPLALKCVAK
jgi:hypothetical protein